MHFLKKTPKSITKTINLKAKRSSLIYLVNLLTIRYTHYRHGYTNISYSYAQHNLLRILIVTEGLGSRNVVGHYL